MNVSVAAIQPAAVIFREEQGFAWWVYALVVGLMLFTVGLFWSGRDILELTPAWLVTMGVGLGIPAVLLVFILRMTTEVVPGQCQVSFGFIPSARYAIALHTLERVEVVSYRPLRDCGGWGIRRGPGGERVLNARGNQGVRLYLTDGSRLLIGSQRCEELARAIEQARSVTA